MNQLNIGTLGKQVGLTPKTIRFYEDIGLISKAKRSENGYRVYEQKTAEELSLIKHARDLGLPITEIKKLMKGCGKSSCKHTKDFVEKEVKKYIETLENKINQLQILKSRLNDLKNNMKTTSENCDDKYCCNILGQIANLSKGGEKVEETN